MDVRAKKNKLKSQSREVIIHIRLELTQKFQGDQTLRTQLIQQHLAQGLRLQTEVFEIINNSGSSGVICNLIH
ncbi:hypothetical protein HR52_10725 [Aeromonas hydrophila]|nr:hypothetical protein HR52_10725 [Aeromonas hydrophila]OCA63718.1 hypothetical protein A9R12_17450 [Aeromonas hydrophila]OCY05495.1 hypothetical protein A9X69_15730 [Aeromonas hydrophila]